jgi:hypothetical protein
MGKINIAEEMLMASRRRKANSWELRYRQRDGRPRSEFFLGGSPGARRSRRDRTAEVAP